MSDHAYENALASVKRAPTCDPPPKPQSIGHEWTGEHDDWFCPRCHAACDHHVPCRHHGVCPMRDEDESPQGVTYNEAILDGADPYERDYDDA